MKNKILRYFGSLAGICLFVLAMVVIHYKLKAYHFSDITAQIHRTSFISLSLAVLLTVLDYFVLTFYDTLALYYLRQQLKYPRIAMASFVGYAFGHNLTILGGSTARYRIYSALGVSAGKVAKLIIFCSITFWVGFLSLAGIAFIFHHQQIPASLHIPLVSIRPLGIIFIAIVIGYMVYVSLSSKPLSFGGWEFAKPKPIILLGQIVISCIDWLLACGVLYVLLPSEIELSYPQFVGIFLLAQIAGLSSSVPGGLGVFETVMLLLLAPFVESSALFGSLLLYRLIYYLIPFGFAASFLVIHELIAGRKILKTAGIAFGRWASIITPHFLALTSFIAGIVLLFSGALPAVKGRMSFLRDIVPLPAVEFSHFLASVVGALLLLLARSIQRRINAAYHLTITLLCAGIVFSLLKGFDYEEASILSLILLAFLPCRKEFYRKAAIFARRFEPFWFAMIAIVVICSVWVGFFSYRHIEYSHQLWWQFAFHSDAPRFLRATSGIAIIVLLYAIMQLLLPHKPKMEPPQSEILGTVRQIVNVSPKISANLALLGDKHFLLNDKNNAFLMYGIEGRSWISMGDPVGPEDEWGELLWKFRELCSYHDGWSVFYQIENAHLDLYLDIGMTFLKLGEEARVDLKEFSLEGPVNRELRYALNKIQKQGYTFDIIPQQQTGEIIDKLQDISDLWLKEKNTREKSFSLGSFSKEYISNFPIAVARKNNDITAFANIWATGQKEELSLDLMRHLPDCPNGIMDYLFVETMLWGKQQGYECFNLGMAPLSGLTDNTLAPLWHKFGTFVFRHGEHFYNFNGLRHYKQKFNPVWQPRYLACPRGLMLPRILTNLASLISGGITGVIAR
jgi:phosphatidylglycerol lysyltransferase